MAGLGGEHLRIPKTVKLFIGGEFPRTESGRSFPVYSHESKKLYAHLCRASRKDLRNSVTAAHGALSSWEKRSAYNRGQILYRMAEMTESKRQEFVDVLMETIGLNNSQANLEVDSAIDAFVFYAGFADKYQQVLGAVNPVSGPFHNFTTPEPVGVVALICSDRFNLGEVAANISSIIVSGNTLVALLAEKGAAILAPLAEVLATSDLPKGVVNLLSGDLNELYKQFGTHMEIQSLSFQNENEVMLGELRAMAAGNMKRVVPKVKEAQSLEHLTSFIEFKTLWHPIGY